MNKGLIFLIFLLVTFSQTFSNEFSPEFVAKVISGSLPDHDPTYLEEFIKGMSEFMPPFDKRSFYAALQEESEAERKLQFKKNLLEAEKFFHSKHINKLIEIIPHKVYYETLYGGEGKVLESFNYEVIASFNIHTLDGYDVAKESVENEMIYSISSLIPGLAHAMIGMREGERRQVYLHPEYGFIDEKIVANQQALIIEIELGKIVRDTYETFAVEPIDFSEYNAPLEFFQKRYNETHLKFAFEYGKQTWNHFRHGKKMFSLDEVNQYLRLISTSALQDLETMEAKKQIFDLHCILYRNEERERRNVHH